MLTEVYQSKEKFTSNEKDFEEINQTFRKKYIVTAVLHDSANGVIYEGVRRSDFREVCFKQVSRRKMTQLVQFEGQTIPIEFYHHKLCSQLDGVVKVLHIWPHSVFSVEILGSGHIRATNQLCLGYGEAV